MKLFCKPNTSAIEKEKSARPFYCIERIDGSQYYLADCNNKITLSINFVDLKPMPEAGDGLYLSENIVDGIKENIYFYTFSTQIGKAYARQPHDFLKNPKEFLILEYSNKKTVLLEQWYG